METRDILRRVRRIEIRTRRLVEEIFAGQSESVFKGRGMEFAEVRPYLAGDEVRDIDWNVTARMGAPFVKRFTEERELTVMLAVDVSGSERFGTRRRFKRSFTACSATIRICHSGTTTSRYRRRWARPTKCLRPREPLPPDRELIRSGR